MAGIKLGNKEIPLKLTVMAMKNIEKKCGVDIADISKWISEGSTAEKLEKLAVIICIMANGYIAKHNADIEFGLGEGEKQEFYNEELFMNMVEISDFTQLKGALYSTVSDGYEFTVPDNVKLEEEDEVLAEIEREKAKKEGNS